MGERRNVTPKKRRQQELVKRKKKKRKKNVVKKIFVSLLTIILVIGVIVAGYIAGFLKDISNNDLPAASKVSIKEPINILLVGLDIGDVNQKENVSEKRTDTIMVINYNPDTEKVHLVSIPRDTLIKTRSGNNAKINAAYKIGGESFLIEKVEELLEVKINYLLKIDYEAFRSIIDAIGGVEMYIERDMYYDDPGQNLHINFKKGETVLLDGQKAEEFFRWRQNNDNTGFADGDLGRIRNQQLLMRKVIEKCMSPSIIIKIPKLLDAISENVETNFDLSGMIRYGLEFIKINPEDIAMTTLQGYFKTINRESYVVFDRDANLEILEALKTGNSTINSIDKENIRLLVLNATNTNGLAGDLKFELNELGYGNIETGNAEKFLKDSVIYTNSEVLGDMLKEETSITKVEELPKGEFEGMEAVIIIGDDYDIFGG